MPKRATMFFVARHAEHSGRAGLLAGRDQRLVLSRSGERQARALARWMGGARVNAAFSSPSARAAMTARIVAELLEIPVEIAQELDEIDFGGAWTGQSFTQLDQDPAWRRWNDERATAITPAGDCMRRVQHDAVSLLQRLHASAEQRIMIVTHAEVVRALLLHCRRATLDQWPSIDVPTASCACIEARTSSDGGVHLEEIHGPRGVIPLESAALVAEV